MWWLARLEALGFIGIVVYDTMTSSMAGNAGPDFKSWGWLNIWVCLKIGHPSFTSTSWSCKILGSHLNSKHWQLPCFSIHQTSGNCRTCSTLPAERTDQSQSWDWSWVTAGRIELSAMRWEYHESIICNSDRRHCRILENIVDRFLLWEAIYSCSLYLENPRKPETHYNSSRNPQLSQSHQRSHGDSVSRRCLLRLHVHLP